MRKIIYANGSEKDIPGEEPFKLEFLQKTVGGYIQIIDLQVPGQIMIMDEEGKIKEKPVNLRATGIARGSIFPSDYVAGDVIVCGRGDVK